MIRRLLVILTLVGLISFNAQAQDPIFSQYYSAPLQINPAFAGHGYAPSFALNYRNQWPSLNAYTTYAASYDQYLDYLNSGFGVMILADDAGEGLLKMTKVSGVYAYRLKINDEFFVKLGAEASVVQARLDWSRLVFLDQIDVENGPISPGGTPYPTEEEQPENLTNVYFDASAGLLLYGKSLYGGFAIKHLNTPNESFLNINNNLNGGLPLRYTVHAGAEISLSQSNKREGAPFISPNLLFVRQGDFGQLNIGAYAGMGMIFGGVWYRNAQSNADAVIALIGVQKGIFKIGYSYDVTVSGLASESGGSHEISVSFRFREPGVDFNDCFQMFR